MKASKQVVECVLEVLFAPIKEIVMSIKKRNPLEVEALLLKLQTLKTDLGGTDGINTGR